MKRILLICCLVLILCQATAWASDVPKEELYIGGVGPGCTMGYVKEIYGEPQEKKWKEDSSANPRWISHYLTYIYSPSFQVVGRVAVRKGREISVDDVENDIKVYSVNLKDNSLSTSNGLTVGMPYEDIVEVLGEGKKRSYNGRTWYQYESMKEFCGINFYIDAKENIEQIYIYVKD